MAVDRTSRLAVADLAEIVATLLPAEPALVEVELPATFTDRDGDAIGVRRSSVGGGQVRLRIRCAGESREYSAQVDVEPQDVDRFVAAVLKAAGR